MKGKPEIILKGWGFEAVIVNNQDYCGKILHFNEGKRCSWHKHLIKDEVFYCAKGEIMIKYGWEEDIGKARTTVLHVGDSFHVEVGMLHQMTAILETDLYEFSTEHIEEDSIRIIKGD